MLIIRNPCVDHGQDTDRNSTSIQLSLGGHVIIAKKMTDPEFRVLEGLTPDEVSAFLDLCRGNSYPDGYCLFKEKTEATTFYLITKGTIELRFEIPGNRQVEGTTITKEGAGAAVGWSVFVTPYTYSLSGYCRGETDVLEIDRDSFHKLFHTNDHMAHIFMRNIATLMGQRLFRMEDSIARYLGTEIMSDW